MRSEEAAMELQMLNRHLVEIHLLKRAEKVFIISHLIVIHHSKRGMVNVTLNECHIQALHVVNVSLNEDRQVLK